MCLFTSKGTLVFINDLRVAHYYNRLYKLLGFQLITLPICTFILQFSLNISTPLILFMELASIWLYSLYWLVKSRELRFMLTNVRDITHLA